MLKGIFGVVLNQYKIIHIKILKSFVLMMEVMMNSLQILETMQKEDKRIMIINQNNLGVSVARNEGLRVASGEKIAFVDADDWIHCQYFEILATCMKDSDIVHCGFVATSNYLKDSLQNSIHENVISRDEGYHNHALKSFCWAKLFKREILEGISFARDVKMAEDKIFVLQAMNRASSITVVDNKLYYYFNHENSAVHKEGCNMFPAGQELLRIGKKTNNAIILYEACAAFLAHRYLHMFDLDYREIRRNTNHYLKECSKLLKTMPLQQRLSLNVLIKFPLVYRFYRICGDHTMLNWERKERKKRKMEEWKRKETME